MNFKTLKLLTLGPHNHLSLSLSPFLHTYIRACVREKPVYYIYDKPAFDRGPSVTTGNMVAFSIIHRAENETTQGGRATNNSDTYPISENGPLAGITSHWKKMNALWACWLAILVAALRLEDAKMPWLVSKRYCRQSLESRNDKDTGFGWLRDIWGLTLRRARPLHRRVPIHGDISLMPPTMETRL